MGYTDRRRFADKFEKHIKMYIGWKFLVNDFHKDTQENCDLLILTMKPFDFACRMRENKYFEPYKGEFTIRSTSKYGLRTEFNKLIDGFGDYMFYGFADKSEKHVMYFTIIDLDVFRSQLIKTPGIIKGEIPNDDGTKFYAFKFSDFPESLIYCQWENPKFFNKPVYQNG